MVDLISDLSATCGLNFRTTAASRSFRMISFFFVFPCCIAVYPVLQKSGGAVHFLLAILFCRCSLLFLDHTFVCFDLKIMARPKSGLVRSFFLVFRCFSTLHFFGGGVPLSSVSWPDPHSSCMLAGQPAM